MKYIYKSLKALAFTFIVAGLGVNVSAIAGGHQSATMNKDIVDTAIGAGSFTTLVAAVQSAELVDALRGDGPYTVFAPSDEAFAKLWPGTVDNLLKPENQETLQALLLYHVVPGKVMSADLQGTTDVETLQGSMVEIVVTEGVRVNGSNVVGADIEASNGVIHVIDGVLLPVLGSQ